MASLGGDAEQLIADAKLVLTYGARTGRLPNNALMTAVTAAEGQLGSGRPSDATLKALGTALSQAVKAIAPVTLLDLGSTWRPYPDSQWKRAGRVAFAVFAVLLILVTSYYTQTYTQTRAILGQLTSIQSRNAHDKAERLFLLFAGNHEKLLPPPGTTDHAVVFEPYLRSYSELLALSNEFTTYSRLSKSLTNRFDLAWLLALVNGSAQDTNPLSQGCIPGYRGPDNKPACEENRQQDPSPMSAAIVPAVVTTGGLAVPASESLIDPPRPLPNVGLDSLSDKQILLEDFLFRSGVDATIARNWDLNSPIYKCQQLLALLGLWVLPALYGLLGATVFQMRAILNALVPPPSPARLFLRLALGGFAGITIFLLFEPDQKTFFEGTSSAINAFGLSFLFGFSIDVFFGILDRLVGMVSESFLKPATQRATK